MLPTVKIEFVSLGKTIKTKTCYWKDKIIKEAKNVLLLFFLVNWLRYNLQEGFRIYTDQKHTTFNITQVHYKYTAKHNTNWLTSQTKINR